MFAKKNLIAVAALATLAVSAQAQSSVTLYGNVDAGLAYVKTKTGSVSQSENRVESSILTESFFGLKGQEDLGGGLKAVFKLESSIAVDTGAAVGGVAGFWDKNAYVGVAGDFGTVKLGRQESLFKTEAAAFDAFGTSFHLATTQLFLNGNGGELGGSWQNTVGYTSPNLSGLTVSAQYSAKEANKAAGAEGGAYSVAANYTAGALALSAVYGDVKNADNTGDNSKNRAFLLGGSYDFGVAKAFAHYGQNKSTVTTTGADVNKATFFDLGAVVPVTQAGSVHAAYGQVKNDNAAAADDKTRKFSLAYHHTLSKRTGVYAGVTYAKADNGPAADTKTTIVAAGLRHAF